MEDQLPFIDIAGFHVLEPMTGITNLLVSLAGYWVVRMLGEQVPGDKEVLQWRRFLGWVAFSTFLAAFAHATGFLWLRVLGWMPAGIGLYFVQLSLVDYLESERSKRSLKVLSAIQLGLFLVLNVVFANFLVSMINMTIGLLILVTYFHLRAYRNSRGIGHLWILGSVGLLLLSAVIHVAKLSLHIHFSHKDIGHVLMAFAILGFGQGVLLLRQKKAGFVEPA